MKEVVMKFMCEFEAEFLNILKNNCQSLLPSYNSTCENEFGGAGRIFDIENGQDLTELISRGMTAKILCKHYPNSRFVYISTKGEFVYFNESDIVVSIKANSHEVVKHIITCPYIEENKHIYELIIEKLGIYC